MNLYIYLEIGFLCFIFENMDVRTAMCGSNGHHTGRPSESIVVSKQRAAFEMSSWGKVLPFWDLALSL